MFNKNNNKQIKLYIKLKSRKQLFCCELDDRQLVTKLFSYLSNDATKFVLFGDFIFSKNDFEYAYIN